MNPLIERHCKTTDGKKIASSDSAVQKNLINTKD